MKKDVDGKETIAHIFEVRYAVQQKLRAWLINVCLQYTTQLSMSSKPALIEPHPNE